MNNGRARTYNRLVQFIHYAWLPFIYGKGARMYGVEGLLNAIPSCQQSATLSFSFSMAHNYKGNAKSKNSFVLLCVCLWKFVGFKVGNTNNTCQTLLCISQKLNDKTRT